MNSIVATMKKVAENEIRKIYTMELGVVTSVFPHASDSDKDNYQCSVILKNRKQPDGSDFELRKVPVATSHIGLVNIPNVGDLVLISFIGGNINAPVIIGRLYNDEDPPPVNQEKEFLLKHSLEKGSSIKIDAEGVMTASSQDEATSVFTLKDESITIVSDKSTISLEGSTITVDNGKCKIIVEDSDVTIEANADVIINKGSKGAARQDDPVEVTIPAGTFITTVSGGSGAPAAGASNPAPVKVQGKITAASGTVKIGD